MVAYPALDCCNYFSDPKFPNGYHLIPNVGSGGQDMEIKWTYHHLGNRGKRGKNLK